jgi:hypothetical protein
MSILTKVCSGSLLFYHCLLANAWAQPAGTDSLAGLSATNRRAYDTALSVYHSYLTPETGLYRGSEYATYDFHLREGNPYFGDKRRRPGTIVYDSVLYNHVLLLYDEVKDLVVVYDVSNLFKIILYPELIDRFTIEGHGFIRLTDSLNPTQPHNGFYEVLYQGGITVLKKEKKVIQEDLSSGTSAQYYIQGADTSYYLKKNNVYYPVKNNKSLLHALKDRSQDVKRFIRSNGLSVRRDRENTLLKVSAWYDTSSSK